MPAIKAIFSMLVIFLFIIVTILIQVFIAFSTTVMSPVFFRGALEESGIIPGISQMALSKPDNIEIKSEDGSINSEATKQLRELVAILKGHIDSPWLEAQLSVIISGIHKYMFTGEEKLPVLDIKPLKSAFIEIITQQALLHSNIGGSKEVLSEARAEFSRRMKFEDIKNTLDINLLVENIFKKEFNYLAGIKRTIAASYKSSITVMVIVPLLLLLMLTLIHFKPKSVLRWCGSAFLAAGLPVIAIVLGVKGLVIENAVESMHVADTLKQQPEIVNSVLGIIKSFIDGFFRHMVIASSVFILLGLILIFLSLLKLHKSTLPAPPGHKAPIRILRALAVLAVILLIPVTISWSYHSISDTIYEFKSHTEEGRNPLKSINLINVIGETIGAEFPSK